MFSASKELSELLHIRLENLSILLHQLCNRLNAFLSLKQQRQLKLLKDFRNGGLYNSFLSVTSNETLHTTQSWLQTIRQQLWTQVSQTFIEILHTTQSWLQTIRQQLWTQVLQTFIEIFTAIVFHFNILDHLIRPRALRQIYQTSPHTLNWLTEWFN